MKKLIYTVVCMMLFCCACSDADIELNPATQAKQQLAMTFRCGAMSPTRAATDDTRIDDINLYLFPANGDPARHLYIAPVRPVVLELPKGDYTLYAIANLGHDAGERTQQSVTVRGDTQIAVSLIRAVAKVNFSYTVAADFAKSFRVKFIQLRSVPRSATLFGSSRAESSEAVADMPPIETSATTYAATYYLLENRQGEVAGIGYQQQKDQTRAPEHATYIAIAGEADGTQVVYRIYLGENNTTDFNVGRNRGSNIDGRTHRHAICREPCAGGTCNNRTAAYIHERHRKCLLLVLSYRRRDGDSRHRRCGTEPRHTLSALFGQRNRNG